MQPKNYSLVFEPDFKSFTFTGDEVLDAYVEKPSQKIILNAAELLVRSCSVACGNKNIAASFALDEDKEELVIRTKEKIRGSCKIHISFEGILNDRLVGFYRSKYKGSDGGEKWLATSHFEASDARRAFPCLDEPAAKATFDVKIVAGSGMEAISNMPVKEKRASEGKVEWAFERTPVMSTYLLYMGVGDFECISGKLGKTEIRIVTPKGGKSRCRLALELTQKFLDFFQKYFDIDYPLPKLDMIAVPDFAMGAMENWGAITFRETTLLFDDNTSSASTKQRVAEVIAHELAHQWFGNLVTMEWWNDLWLNESFATFMATKAVDKSYPEWKMWDQFLLSYTNRAMELDALKTSHPIDVKVESPSQVREIFDEISYDKGGNVLRMLEDYVGEDAFRKGLKNYLSKHAYGNATTGDLWNAIGKASGKPVRTVMNTWVRQTGYPILDAAKRGQTLVLSQKRFVLESGGKPGKERWMIPLSIGIGHEKIKRLMAKGKVAIRLPHGAKIADINTERLGFYRVGYSRDLLVELGTAIGESKLSNTGRWGIENDLLALCMAGKSKIRSYTDILEHYHGESDYLVAADIEASLGYLLALFWDEPFVEEVKDLCRKFCRPIFDRLGWEPKKGESQTDILLRSYTIAMLGRLGDKAIEEAAKDKFTAFLSNRDSLSPDLRSAVFGLTAWSGDADTHTCMRALYAKAVTQEEKIRFLAALCSFADKALLLKSLDFSLTDEVRAQDMVTPLAAVANNPHGKSIVWPWLRANWGRITDKLGSKNPLLGRMIGCLEVLADFDTERQVKQFFAANKVRGAEMELAQTLEKIRINAAFLEKAKKELS